MMRIGKDENYTIWDQAKVQILSGQNHFQNLEKH